LKGFQLIIPKDWDLQRLPCLRHGVLRVPTEATAADKFCFKEIDLNSMMEVGTVQLMNTNNTGMLCFFLGFCQKKSHIQKNYWHRRVQYNFEGLTQPYPKMQYFQLSQVKKK